MSYHSRKLTISLSNLQKTSVYAHFATWEGKGIGRWILKHLKFPARTGQIDHGLETICDPIHLRARARIS